MTMLLIDAGNSRVKWATVESDAAVKLGAWVQYGALDNAHITPQMFAEIAAPNRVLLSNVAGEKVAQGLLAACAKWPCKVELIAAQRQQCGVHNVYQEPAQLGSDRWVALIAAWQQEGRACLVVNCGTATTVDALSMEGNFMGGLILPGIEIMQRSLAHSTAQLMESAGSLHAFPRNTADAIYSGAMRATLGAIQQQFAVLVQHVALKKQVNDEAKKSDSPTCLLSGGAAHHLQPHLTLPTVFVADLVLRGLQIIAQEVISPENISPEAGTR